MTQLHAQLTATTSNDESRLIIMNLYVAGSRRPSRALLDPGATNNFFRASCLSLLPARVPVRDSSGEVVVKLADGKPHPLPLREVSLSYTFDGAAATTTSWLYPWIIHSIASWVFRGWYDTSHQIDRLSRSFRRRKVFDVSKVFTHLLVAPKDWPHVAVL